MIRIDYVMQLVLFSVLLTVMFVIWKPIRHVAHPRLRFALNLIVLAVLSFIIEPACYQARLNLAAFPCLESVVLTLVVAAFGDIGNILLCFMPTLLGIHIHETHIITVNPNVTNYTVLEAL
jgi:hypothetical protein